MSSYCQFCRDLPPDTDNPNRHYHDHEHGKMPIDDNGLFERLLLEINQTGLNWTMILHKREHLRQAYAQFDVARVAAFDEHDVARLLNDAGIVRHRLKVQAAVFNARQIVQLQQQHGSFRAWLEKQPALSLNQWVKLFKQHFKFMGNEIVGEFLRGIGLLAGAHDSDCPHNTLNSK